MRIKRSTAFLFLLLGFIILLSSCRETQGGDVYLDEPIATATGSLSPTGSPISEVVSDQMEASSSEGFLNIYQTQWYLDQAGICRVVGLIRNNSDRTINNIQVEIQIYDVSDHLLLSDTTSTALYTLTPGETTPFVMWCSTALSSADHVASKIVAYSEGKIQRAEVEVRGVTLTLDDDYDVHISGELYNHNLDPIVVYGLAAAIFDGQGRLLTADTQTVGSQYLDPGEFGPFRVTMIGIGEAPPDKATHTLFIDAGIVPPEDFFDIQIHEGPRAYLDGNGSFHLVGEVTNNSIKNLNVDLLAATYDEDDKVIDASSTNLPLLSIAPGETLPFEFDYWGPMSYKDGTFESAWKYSVQWNPYLTWSNGIKYVPLSTRNQVHKLAEMYGTFGGEVFNDSGSQLTSTTVMISLYDQTTGKIIAMDYATIDSELPAGDTIPYEIVVDFDQSINSDTTDIVILAVGEILE